MKCYIASGKGLCRFEGHGHCTPITGGPPFTIMDSEAVEVNLFIPYDKSTWPAEGVEVEVWSQYILDRGGSPGQAKIRSGQWVFTRHCGLPISCWRPIVWDADKVSGKWEQVEGFDVWVKNSGGRKGVIVAETNTHLEKEPIFFFNPHYRLFINGEPRGLHEKKKYAMEEFEEEDFKTCM